MITSAPERSAGATSALAAARTRLGLVALLFAVAALGWWSTAQRMPGMDAGPWTALGALGFEPSYTMHELIAHRLVQILFGLHRGRVFSIA